MPTYGAGLARLVVGGNMLSGKEVWNFTLMMQNSSPVLGDQELAERAWTAVAAWYGSPDARIAANAKLNWVKFNRINTQGRYVATSTTALADHYTDPVSGGGSASVQFPQLAVAVSLTTASKRGRAHRGRFYPPMPVVDASTTGQITTSQVSQIANAASTLIGNLNQTMGDYRVVVASGLDGTMRLVEGVAVGSVIDTQRRRRSALDEIYEERPVALHLGAGEAHPL